jgi:dipeptidyl aminopeptidase/acylaminoacyl peptidase
LAHYFKPIGLDKKFAINYIINAEHPNMSCIKSEFIINITEIEEEEMRTTIKIIMDNIFNLKIFIIIYLLLNIYGINLATSSPGFSVEQILSSPFPSSLTAASSGQPIAWVFNNQGIGNIWMAKGPDFKARQITQFKKDDGRPIRICGFVENKSLLFSKNFRFNPDQNPLPDKGSKLFLLNLSTGEMKKIADTGNCVISPDSDLLAYTSGEAMYVFSPDEEPVKRLSNRGRLSQLTWSPKGEHLAMASNRGEFPNSYSYIIIYSLEQKSFKYIDASIYTDTSPVWSPDGEKIAFLRRLTSGHLGVLTAKVYPKPDPWEIRVTDVSTGKTLKVWESLPTDNFNIAQVNWLDNENLVFSSEADGWCHLYLYDLKNKKMTQLTKGEFEIERFYTDTRLKKALVTCNAQDIDRRHIWSVDGKGKMKALTSGYSIEWNPIITGDKKFMAYFGSTATQPAQVYVKPLDGGKERVVASHTLPASFPRNLVVPKQVIFKSSDGWDIHGQLFIPTKKSRTKRPAVMHFHGGPVRQMLLGFHYSSYYHRAYAMNQYLASQGYVVLSVNFRLGIGYGRAFRDVPDGGPRGCSEYRDLLAGAKFLRSLDFVDSNRIGLWGGSYGGLMTALGLARNSDLFAAGVDFHGVHDWNQWQAWGMNEENDRGRIEWKSSPLADIAGWRSPVLLIHGDDDRNVPFSETQWLTKMLKKQGVYYELLVFPDDVHGFLLHRNWVKAFEATASFFDRKLKKPE